MKKVAIVAGNGPSLAKIDYTLLPQEYDVFRCNQFYCEDKYYLGKKIKAVSFASQMVFEQIYTMLHLNNQNEYDIESIFLRDIFSPHVRKEQINSTILSKYFDNHEFIHRIFQGKYSHNINKFLEYVKLQELYFYKHITTGVFLCAIAIAMGYQEIYIVGIDFYEGATYAFDVLQPNITLMMPSFISIIRNESIIQKKKNQGELRWHTKQADIDALYFLEKHYNVNFYSLSSESPLTQYFPLPSSYPPPPRID